MLTTRREDLLWGNKQQVKQCDACSAATCNSAGKIHSKWFEGTSWQWSVRSSRENPNDRSGSINGNKARTLCAARNIDGNNIARAVRRQR